MIHPCPNCRLAGYEPIHDVWAWLWSVFVRRELCSVCKGHGSIERGPLPPPPPPKKPIHVVVHLVLLLALACPALGAETQLVSVTYKFSPLDETHEAGEVVKWQ